jgi:hypothetical protein
MRQWSMHLTHEAEELVAAAIAVFAAMIIAMAV